MADGRRCVEGGRIETTVGAGNRDKRRTAPYGDKGGQRMSRSNGADQPGWVRAMAGTITLIDGTCRWSGYIVAWATLATVLLCFATVYLRYVMGMGLIWLQESYVWTHVIVIVLGAGYTMMSGGFVRVDVFYANWSNRRRALSDLLMTLFALTPFL